MKFGREIMDKVDDLTLRERAAVFLAILAICFFIWDSYLMASLNDRQRGLQARLQRMQAEQTALNAELQQLIAELGQDGRTAQRQRLEALRQSLEETRQQVLDSTEHLIAPSRMARVLENVLERTEGLELLEASGLGSSPLAAEVATGGGEAATAAAPRERQAGTARDVAHAYKHGLEIVFRGSFMDTLDYLRRLEALENSFIWDRLLLEIEDYPLGRVSITVYTLSLDQDWIGT